MLTMQAFYTQLSTEAQSGDAYLAWLTRLTQASRVQLASLEVGWDWWS